MLSFKVPLKIKKMYEEGTKVVAHRLITQSELNGMTGTIRSWSAKLDRYLIVMENGVKVALKAESLLVDASPTTPTPVEQKVPCAAPTPAAQMPINSLSHIKVWPTNTTTINSVCFSPDGTYIISGSMQGMVNIWNISTETNRKIWLGPGLLSDMAISTNGQYVASSHGILSRKHGSNTIRLWNFQTGENIHKWKGHEDSVRCVAFSSDDKYVVSGSHDNTLRLWKVGSEDAIQVWRGHIGSVRSVAFSPDGKYVVSGSWDHMVKVWAVGGGSDEAIVNDLTTIAEKIDGILHCEFGHQSAVHSVAFSPDGKYVVSASEEIIVCDFTSREFESGRKNLHRWQSHTNVVL